MSMSRFPNPVKHPRTSYPGKPPRALPTMGGFEQMPVSKPQRKGTPQKPFGGVKRAKTKPLDRDASGVK